MEEEYSVISYLSIPPFWLSSSIRLVVRINYDIMCSL